MSIKGSSKSADWKQVQSYLKQHYNTDKLYEQMVEHNEHLREIGKERTMLQLGSDIIQRMENDGITLKESIDAEKRTATFMTQREREEAFAMSELKKNKELYGQYKEMMGYKGGFLRDEKGRFAKAEKLNYVSKGAVEKDYQQVDINGNPVVDEKGKVKTYTVKYDKYTIIGRNGKKGYVYIARYKNGTKYDTIVSSEEL